MRQVEAAIETKGLEGFLRDATDGDAQRAMTVAFGPEDGFLDLIQDVTAALNQGGWRYCAFDAALTLDRVLVTDYDDGVTYVVPIQIGDDGEPVVSSPADWTSVEQGWIAAAADDDDAGRAVRDAVRAVTETRAGKTLSRASLDAITAAITQLQDLVAKSTVDAGDGDGGDGSGGDEANQLDLAKVEWRLKLEGLRAA